MGVFPSVPGRNIYLKIKKNYEPVQIDIPPQCSLRQHFLFQDFDLIVTTFPLTSLFVLITSSTTKVKKKKKVVLIYEHAV